MPGLISCALLLMTIILLTSFGGTYYCHYSHFKGEKSEAQRGWGPTQLVRGGAKVWTQGVRLQKGLRTQRKIHTETCNDTHIGPAVSPVPSPSLIEVQTWKWQRQRKHLGEHAGTFELGCHGITSQHSDFCHAHNLYHDFKMVGTAVYLLKVYR